MFPEDGCLWVYGVGEDSVPAFTKELAATLGTAKSGGLIMAAIAQVFTISFRGIPYFSQQPEVEDNIVEPGDIGHEFRLVLAGPDPTGIGEHQNNVSGIQRRVRAN
jgi:hypothetical protein